MAKALIIYYSRSGNTREMARLIAQGLEKEGVEAVLKDVGDVKAEELLAYDAIVAGSPTYYGTMSYQLKRLFDESVRFHGKLDGKVGAAFSSSANIGGGNETTVLEILNAMLIHGMIVQGDPQGDHYGAVSIEAPDKRASAQCARMGVRIARLLRRLR